MWSFKLSARILDWAKFTDIEDPNSRAQAFKLVLQNEVNRCREEYEYVTGRDDVLQSVQTIASHTEWTILSPDLTHGLDDFLRSSLTEFDDNLCDILSRARNIETVLLSNLNVNKPTQHAISNLLKLRTIRMADCEIELTRGDSVPLSPLWNLNVSASKISLGPSTWHLLSHCTDLRTLYINYDAISDSDPDDPLAALERYNPFKTLERVFLQRFCTFGLDMFMEAIVESKAKYPLRLTHFKLDIAIGIDREVVVELLDTLRGSPMQTFILDGTAYAEPELFDLIAQTFPDLRCLTVVYRDSSRQTNSKPARWPHTTWDYACHFRHFEKLTHFSWNVDLPYVFFTPAIMLDFEDDFENDHWLESRFDHEATDIHDMGKIFANFCPSLVHLALTSRFLGCRISRKEDGTVDLAGINGSDWSKDSEGWNPDWWEESWYLF